MLFVPGVQAGVSLGRCGASFDPTGYLDGLYTGTYLYDGIFAPTGNVLYHIAIGGYSPPRLRATEFDPATGTFGSDLFAQEVISPQFSGERPLALDPKTLELFVLTFTGVDVLDSLTGNFVRTIALPAPSNPTDLAIRRVPRRVRDASSRSLTPTEREIRR